MRCPRRKKIFIFASDYTENVYSESLHVDPIDTYTLCWTIILKRVLSTFQKDELQIHSMYGT